MSDFCPVCENKTQLFSMDMTPQMIFEMAQQEPCADYIGDEQYNKRLLICQECKNLIGGMTCKNCGCFVHFRAKHISAHCIEGKW